MVCKICKIIFCSEFSDIPDKAGRVTRRRIQAIAKSFAFQANAIIKVSAGMSEQIIKQNEGIQKTFLQPNKLFTP